MAVQDIGLRIVILGVAESRRSIGSVKSDLSGLERAIRGVSGASAGLGTSLTQMGNAMMGFGRTLSLFLTAPIVFAGASMLKAGMDYEDAFAGVAKTTEGVAWGIREVLKWTPGYLDGALEILALSNQQSIANHEAEETWMTLDQALDIYISQLSDAEKATLIAHENFGQLTEAGQALKDTFLDLSLKIPVSAAELAEIGRAAGQMGVPMDQLEGFVETIAKITFATEMEGEEAAMSMARFARILGVTSEGLAGFAGEYGDVLIHLGNISAATEPEINTLALRLAALGPIAGLSMEEILGLSAAITEMGIRPERGGTAMRRFFLEIGYAIADGNENLDTFAAQLKMTGDEFIKAFGEDPANLVLNLMESIAEAQEKNLITGEQMTAWGLGGVRVTEFLQILGSNLPRVTELMNEANKAKILGIALDEESAKRWRTLSSQVQILKNHIAALSIEIFNLYYKDLKKLVAGMQQVVRIFLGLPDNVKKGAVAFAAFSAALGPALVAFGLFLQTAGTAISFFTGALSPLLRIVPLFSGAFLPMAAVLGAAYLAFKINLGGIRTEIERFISSIKSSEFTDFLRMWITDTIANAEKGNWELIRELGIPILADELAKVMGLTDGENTLIPKINKFIDDVEQVLTVGLERIKTGIEGFSAGLSGVDTEALAKAIGKLAIGLVGLGLAFASVLTLNFEEDFPKLGTAIAEFTNAASYVVLGQFGDALKSFAAGLDALGQADLLGAGAALLAWRVIFSPLLATGIALVSSAINGFKLALLGIVANPILALGLTVFGIAFYAYTNNLFGFRDAINGVASAIQAVDWQGEFQKLLDGFNLLLSDPEGTLTQAATWIDTNIVDPITTEVKGVDWESKLDDIKMEGDALVNAVFSLLGGTRDAGVTAVTWIDKNIIDVLVAELEATDWTTKFDTVSDLASKVTTALINALTTTSETISLAADWVGTHIVVPIKDVLEQTNWVAEFAIIGSSVTTALYEGLLAALSITVPAMAAILNWTNTNIARPIIDALLLIDWPTYEEFKTVLLGIFSALFSKIVSIGGDIKTALETEVAPIIAAGLSEVDWQQAMALFFDAYTVVSDIVYSMFSLGTALADIILDNAIAPLIDAFGNPDVWAQQAGEKLGHIAAIIFKGFGFAALLTIDFLANSVALPLAEGLIGAFATSESRKKFFKGGADILYSIGRGLLAGIPRLVWEFAQSFIENLTGQHITISIGPGGVVMGAGGTPFIPQSAGPDWLNEAGGFIADVLKSLGLPGGASGATVTPGKPLWVGEMGRELLWPKIPGVITSHRDSKKIVKLLTRTFSTNQAITRLLTRPSVYVPRTPSVYHSVYSPNFYAPPTQELISTNRSMYSDWLYAQQKG